MAKHSIFQDKRLGFGLMRLPKKNGLMDHELICKMADAYLAGGFSYFDTAYVYPGSEEAFREAVAKQYPRESYTIADKMAGWVLKSGLTPEKMFSDSLERCGVSYFDYYLLHSLTSARIADYDRHDCWQFVRQMKEQGRIRHLGFSFHGEPDLLAQILDAHPEMEFVQIQINYADWDSNAIWSRRNYEICRQYNKEIIVMEPVKGGFLASLPIEAEKEMKEFRPKDSPAAWALRYAASLPGVAMVLSGMSSVEQVHDNLSTFIEFEPVSEDESKVIAKVSKMLTAADTIQCTACRYCCKGCPKKIDIPEVFKAMNMLINFGEHIRPHLYYDNLRAMGSGRAKDCISCGQCESICPQHLPVIKLLKQCSERLDK